MKSVFVCLILASFALQGRADDLGNEGPVTYDLTHPFNEDSLVWPGDTPYTRSIIMKGRGMGLDW